MGRFALIALLGVVALFTHRMVGERGSVRAIARATGNLGFPPWAWRVIHAAMLAIPVGLAGAAARGYAWTAFQLAARYHLTLVFVFLLAVALQLALRWMMLARRRIAFEQWRAQREAQRAAETTRAEDTGERTVLPEPELDLGVVDAQTRRLITTSAVVAVLLGLWLFWADFVPALGVLDEVQLWSSTETRIVQMTAPDGTRQSHSEQIVVPITLANVLAGALIAFMTYVIARNLAGLLEVSLFRRWQPGPGERYAITSLARYSIILVGGVAGFNALGIGWSKLQWLVAAIGLGLGFGLQEIFANFVSGLILLFERPIRVGDTVTVDGTSGTVSKIQIRATRITAFDRKELVVPNKQFVTQQVVNWSLTDDVLRVEIPVGLAYGTDVERAMAILLEVAQAREFVREEPRPRALFLGFGPGSLNLELRVYTDVEHSLAVRHELNVAIERAFREAGVRFPPQSPPLAAVPAPAQQTAPEPPAPKR
jgi:potassium efflux system protein